MQPVRLIVVEDMPMEAEIAVRQLESGGFTCSWKRVDSEAALRAALAEAEPDIILSDFTLPGFDGISALEISREIAPDTPFIFLSGTLGEERAIDALQRGAYDYVLKTNMARIVPAVRRALNDSAIRRARVALEQQLRDIVATSQDWIWEHDRDGKFTFCSDSVRSTLGYAPEEMIGTECLAVRSSGGSCGARFRDAHAGPEPAHRHQPAGAMAPSQRQLSLAGAKHAGVAGRGRSGRWVIAARSATSPNAAARKNTSAV